MIQPLLSIKYRRQEEPPSSGNRTVHNDIEAGLKRVLSKITRSENETILLTLSRGTETHANFYVHHYLTLAGAQKITVKLYPARLKGYNDGRSSKLKLAQLVTFFDVGAWLLPLRMDPSILSATSLRLLGMPGIT
ncbi:hypothetical protein MPH_13750 [Macrophomina phaseolina MS6]|uniref:Uncharacterized protein n=1 Tax=Macrophomina phaseolina (strain MS6) TaxID=1126212 RepID=K2R4W0_MACPH|nr:hypothetical protein MPH_13750 [Macrophomina phaseolina MS6]